VIWNLATRSPLRLARDLAGGIGHPARAAGGFARLVWGLLLLVAAAALLLPIAIVGRTFIVLETWTVLTGLLVELLVGADLRARRPPPRS